MGKMLYCKYWFTLITVDKICIYYYMFQKTTSAEGTLKEAESNATSSYLYCSKYWNIDTRRVATCTQSTQLPTRCHRTEQSKMLQSAIKLDSWHWYIYCKLKVSRGACPGTLLTWLCTLHADHCYAHGHYS